MGAPKPFSLKPPTEATEIPVREGGKPRVDHGPNLFLQADTDHGFPRGWFMGSYESGRWFDVNPAVSGDFVIGQVEKGPNKGKEIERMTGDLVEVTRQLREAANTLGLGVSIKYFPATYKNGPKAGEEIPGKWVVKYLAGKRKQKRTPAEATPVTE